MAGEGLSQSFCSLASSEEEGKGYLGSEGLGQGTLSIEGPCSFVFSFGVGLLPCVLNRIVLENRGHRRPEAWRKIVIAVLNRNFSDHLGSLH